MTTFDWTSNRVSPANAQGGEQFLVCVHLSGKFVYVIAEWYKGAFCFDGADNWEVSELWPVFEWIALPRE